MNNQIQIIKTFAERSLGDLSPILAIDRDVNGREIANGDRASAVLSTRNGRHRIALTSSYIDPPLGRVVMIDLSSQQRIEGGKSDAVWNSIAAHIRGGKREEPTATPIEVREPAKEPEIIPDRLPHLGQGVTFYTERNEPIGGMFTLAAIVTEIHSPTEVSLTVFPRTGEQFWRERVPRKLGSREFFCWDFSDALPSAVYIGADNMSKSDPGHGTPHRIYLPDGYQLPDELSDAPGAVTWLKRKPGRPPQG